MNTIVMPRLFRLLGASLIFLAAWALIRVWTHTRRRLRRVVILVAVLLNPVDVVAALH